jgi:DNA-binding NarL/FixJ family response regulator
LAERQTDWEVDAVASDGRDALRLSRPMRPDVVIINVSTSDKAALALTQLLGRESPGSSVLFYTSRDDDDSIMAALAAGVRGYVLKKDNFQHVEAAIAALGAGRLYFCPRVSALLLDRASRPIAVDPGCTLVGSNGAWIQVN